MTAPTPPKIAIKQPTWHPHYDDESADIVFVSKDGIKFGMSLKLLAKSSTVFADMGKLPTPAPNLRSGEQPINLDYDQTTVLQFIQLVSIHEFDLIVPHFDFAACQSLLALSIQFDCGRFKSAVRYQLYGKTYDEEKAWELFKFAADRDDWSMGRQALRRMYSDRVAELLETSSAFEEVLDKLPLSWQLALSKAILSSFIDDRRLVMDWSGQASSFHRPGSLMDKGIAASEESNLCQLAKKKGKKSYARHNDDSE